MRTVAMIALKGGVGKTSICFHASGVLARRGLRTLVVDNDPQGSLGHGFGVTVTDPRAPSVAMLYDPDADPDPDALLCRTAVPGVTLVPGSAAASRWNRAADDEWPASQWGLKAFLRAVAGDFDVCLIDCPPNLYLASWAALLAAEAACVPVVPEDFGSQGITPVLASIAAARLANPALELAGLVVTMAQKRTALHQTYEAMIREHYGDTVFASVVPRAMDFPEAVAARRPVTHYKPRSAASKAVTAVADELLARLDARDARVAAHNEVA